MLDKNKNTVKSKPKILTDAIVERLIGHRDVIYYNYEINEWNTSRYNGYVISYNRCLKEFKMAMETPIFGQQYEFTAPVIMTIDSVSFNGWAKPVSKPSYSRGGTAIVGNIIVKNKTTGNYELYCKSWVGVNDYVIPFNAVRYGADEFASNGAYDSGFRAALIAAHTQNKSR